LPRFDRLLRSVGPDTTLAQRQMYMITNSIILSYYVFDRRITAHQTGQDTLKLV
jgi:hypothetical protein